MPIMLSITMNTDDDAEIIFEGQSYCFYGSDLKIARRFETLEKARQFIKKEIVVPKGYKASTFTRNWLDTCADDMVGNDDNDFSYSGNQEFSIWWSESFAVTTEDFTPIINALARRALADADIWDDMVEELGITDEKMHEVRKTLDNPSD